MVAILTKSSLVIVPIVAETVEVGGVADTNEEGGIGLTTLENVDGGKEKVAEVVDEIGVEVEMLEE